MLLLIHSTVNPATVCRYFKLNPTTPGGATIYTIVASNPGPDPANPVTVTDNFPAACSASYTSFAAGGATGNTAAGFSVVWGDAVNANTAMAASSADDGDEDPPPAP